MRRTLTIATTLLVAALSLTALLGRHAPPGAPAASGTTVDITIKDGKVTPNGDRVKAKVGRARHVEDRRGRRGRDPRALDSRSRRSSSTKGTSTKKLTIDQPGIVDVEDHALEQVIVQLQVS